MNLRSGCMAVACPTAVFTAGTAEAAVLELEADADSVRCLIERVVRPVERS